MSINSNTLKHCKLLCQQYSELKEKQNSIEKQLQNIKNQIEDICLNNNTNTIHTNVFSIDRKIIKQFRISKDDLPENIFEQYCRPISFSTIKIKSFDSSKK